ncbi:MAG: nitric oxide synthase oxygenase [Phenylobacterium sp.]|nr:nitric oxide synthase oxygenase [Phenylobacterium sp.]
MEEALAFIRLFNAETSGSHSELAARAREVRRDLGRHGFYRHSPEELAFGARVAWRNHSRCIGRLFWKSLEVIDCRAADHPDQVADLAFSHMVRAGGDGPIRSIISIFAPVEGDRLPVWIENRQVAQYAGYVSDAGVIGDPANLELTRIATGLGWRPPEPPTPFDLLPLVVRDRSGRRVVYALPEGVVREVEIRHPTSAALGDLGLRWYTVPCVSDMILTIGGIDYPCAPFNGWYMATEIASRNFTDPFRYDLSERAADALGLDRSDRFWRDQVSIELNRAVVHSFGEAGATVVDHHIASAQYMEFDHAERMRGRIPSSEWSWIVPPQASSACPVFHQPMQDTHDVPNFYRSRAEDGEGLAVSRLTEQRDRVTRRVDRIVRRWRRWRRLRD